MQDHSHEQLKKTVFTKLALDEPFCLMAKGVIWYKKLEKDAYDKLDSGRRAVPGNVMPRDFRVRDAENKKVFVRPGPADYRVHYTGTDVTNNQSLNGFMIIHDCENATAAEVAAFAELQKRAGIKDGRIAYSVFIDYA